MNYIDAINERYSVRKYGAKLDTEQINFLNLEITELSFKSGLDIILVLDGKPFDNMLKSYGLFKNVTSYIAICGNKNDPYIYQKAGYYGEKIVLDATILGIKTCFVGGTYDAKKLKLDLYDDFEVLILIVVGNSESDKKSIKYRLMHPKRKLEHFYTGSFCSKWFKNGIECVSKMPSALNRCPIKFHYDNGKVKVINNGKDKYSKIDEGIAILHFEIGSEKKIVWW